MHILNSQHQQIVREFPGYDRNNSRILCEGGSDTVHGYVGTFVANVYRKGKFVFHNDGCGNTSVRRMR